MLKENVSYLDFDGVEQTETLYFNINRMELIAMQARYGKEDMAKYIERITKEEDFGKIHDLLNDIVLTAYGKKSEDGKRFIKSEELKEEFRTSLAYEALIEKFFDDEGQTLGKFVQGITSTIRGLESAAAAPAAQ